MALKGGLVGVLVNAAGEGLLRALLAATPDPFCAVEVPAFICLPADGVYAGWYERPDGSRHMTAINLGRRPTFYEHADKSMLEAHLIDFSGDLYGETAKVCFTHFLRSERKFDGIDALRNQLKQDVDHARTVLA